MSLEPKINCPICGNTMELFNEEGVLKWRLKSYTVKCYHYLCRTCDESFDTEESMDATLSQIPGYMDAMKAQSEPKSDWIADMYPHGPTWTGD